MAAASYLIFSALSLVSIYLFIDNTLVRKKVSNKIILIGYILYYIVGIIMVFGNAKWYANTIFVLIADYLMTRFYSAQNRKRIICALFINILHMCCDTFIYVALTALVEYTPIKMSDDVFYSIGIATCMILQCIVVVLVNPLYKERNIELPRIYWITAFLAPGVSTIFLFMLNYQVANGKIDSLIFLLMTTGFIFLFSIFAFFYYDRMYKGTEVINDYLSLVQSHDNHQKEAALLHQSLGKISATKHDLDSHLATGMGIAVEQKNNEMIAYFEPLVGEIRNIETGIKSGSPTIDTTLNGSLYTAKDQNTQLHIDLNIKEEIPINPIDLTTILSNLLNNALEACIKLPEGDRQIWFYLKHERGVLNVRVENTYNPDAVDIQDGKAYTTKEDKSSHGIGLKRIQQTVEKYNGTFTYRTKTTERGEIFEAKAMLFTK